MNDSVYSENFNGLTINIFPDTDAENICEHLNNGWPLQTAYPATI